MPSALGLALTFAQGRGRLSLRDRDFAGLGHVDVLELDVPNLRFPCDLSGGVARFRKYRLSLHQLALGLGAQDLAGWLSPAALGAFGIFEPRIFIDGARLGLAARAVIGGREAEMTAAAVISPLPPRSACLCLHDVQVYGFLPVPAPLVGLAIFSALGGQTPVSGDEGERPLPLVSIVSASEIRVEVGELALLALLPMNGWRLPDRAQVRIRSIGGLPGTDRLHLVLGPTEVRDGALDQLGQLDQLAHDDVLKQRVMRDFATRASRVEAALAVGDVAAALTDLRALAPVEAQDKVGTQRLLQVLTADSGTLAEAGQVAQSALAEWPTFAPALLALAVVASERGEAAEAGACFERLAELFAAQGRREEQSCALLAAALHCGRARQNSRALAHLEGALAKRVGMGQAARARVGELALAGRWGEILSAAGGAAGDGCAGVLPEQLSRLLDDAALAERDPARLAQAAALLDVALGLDPAEARVLEALERVARAMGDPRAVVEILRRRLRESRPAQGKALLRVLIRLMADCAELADDVGDACAILLELAPGDAEALFFQARSARAGVEGDRGRGDGDSE